MSDEDSEVVSVLSLLLTHLDTGLLADDDDNDDISIFAATHLLL